MQRGQGTFRDKSHLHVGVICVLNINLSFQNVSKYYNACKLYMIILLLLLYGWKLKKRLKFTSDSMLCEMESASLSRTLDSYTYEQGMPLEFAGIWGRASDMHRVWNWGLQSIFSRSLQEQSPQSTSELSTLSGSNFLTILSSFTLTIFFRKERNSGVEFPWVYNSKRKR